MVTRLPQPIIRAMAILDDRNQRTVNLSKNLTSQAENIIKGNDSIIKSSIEQLYKGIT